MCRANIHRRDTVEQVYWPEAFAGDAARNGGASNEFMEGVCPHLLLPRNGSASSRRKPRVAR
jgi:hypothetical protein